MIKKPLYSNIIMSIKFAKRFKHHHSHHFCTSSSPLYHIRPHSTNNIPVLTCQLKENHCQEVNAKIEDILDMQDEGQVKKTLGFFDFPTNISEFQDAHEDLNLNTVSNMPSFSEQIQDRSHGQRQ